MDRLFQWGYNARMGDDTIASLIRQQRESAGLTQKELGEAIEITDRRISEWETGRAIPNRESIRRLSRFFKIGVGEFYRRMPQDADLIDAVVEVVEEHKQDQHGHERVRASLILEALLHRPEELEQWLAYGEYLRDRKH